MERPNLDYLPLDVQARIALIDAIAAGSSMTVAATHRARDEARRRPGLGGDDDDVLGDVVVAGRA